MARVPDVARCRFFSGMPLDTFVELLFFRLKTGVDQKKGLHVRRATVFLLKSGENYKKVFMSGADLGEMPPHQPFSNMFLMNTIFS